MASRLEDVILRDVAASRPAAAAVPAGTLYFSTDTEVLERSTGSAWEAYSAAAASGGITQLTTDVTAGPGSGSQVATIAAHAVTDGKLRQSAPVAVIGNATGSTADVADIAAGADDRLLARTGGALGFVQVTAGMLPSSVVATAKIAANAVDDTKLRQGAADSVIGNATGSTANVADIVAAADDRVLARTGGALSFAQLTVGMFPADVVTYAKIQNVSATSRVLGRKTAGAGDLEELTVSEVLDFIVSAAQGDILYRGASAWARLAAGTAGQFLKTQGAGADPVWDTPAGGGSSAYTLVATPTVTGTNIDVTGLSAYDEILVILKAITFGSSAIASLRVSTNNGSTFLSTSGDYIGISGAGNETGATLLSFYSTASNVARSSAIRITPFKTSGAPKVASAPFFSGDSIGQQFIATTSALNAVRVTTSGGATFTGGTIYVLGR